MRQLFVTGIVLMLSSLSVHAADNALINKIKSTWRAQDGETVEQIFANVSKVAHFVPRGVGKSARPKMTTW